MGAEVGATTSIFAYDDSMERYLISTDRQDVVEAASIIKHELRSDDEVYKNPGHNIFLDFCKLHHQILIRA